MFEIYERQVVYTQTNSYLKKKKKKEKNLPFKFLLASFPVFYMCACSAHKIKHFMQCSIDFTYA